MVIKSRENNIGAWAFLVGVVLSVIVGVATSTLLEIPQLTKYSSTIFGVLFLLGILIGFVNLRVRDVQPFLFAGAVVVIVSGFGMDSVSGSLIGFPIAEMVKTVFGALLTMFVPATIIVALRAVFSVAVVNSAY